ncbi:MAG TPA: FAD-dependent oxidoreductase [Microbacteriaceae bacterium]|nr:FAD-dependent oxidoreductase [Microbacteriaceae bacterium]
MVERFLIVGGGLAAATAANALRKQRPDVEIVIYAAEAHHPYLRPPLSKEFLTGKETIEQTLVRDPDWYPEHAIQVRTGVAVTALGDHRIELADGSSDRYDKLLLATGARARRLEAPGADADGVFTLRTLDDAQALKARLTSGDHNVVMVGAGWIGLELAAAARGYGNEVTVVAPGAIPLSGPLGDELGALFREVHESHGVRFRMETRVEGFETADGRVTGVRTDQGSLPADLVIVGIGAVPVTELAEAAGISVDNGILVDEHLATDRADVYAAGDVANAFHPVLGRRMRNEHWANALAGGKVAAASMAGVEAVLDDIPYFYTDQFELGTEYWGYPPLTAEAELVLRGDRGERKFIAFWLAEGRVVAGMSVNVWKVNKAVQELIRSGRQVDRARLTDLGVPLEEV